ncbi:MAG: hypothetical protein GY788_23820 [bacterium]|nr:hypothetical protein [bacterium]
MNQDFDIGVYLGVLRRRYLYLVVPTIVIIAVAVFVANKMPKIYEAKAVILVESQQIPTALVTPTVTAHALERIHTIQQRLMTRDTLLEIASKYSLYGSPGERPAPTKVADRMRDAVSIEQIDIGSRRATNVIGFTVSFQYPDATVVTLVVNELVDSILSRNIQARLGQAAETSRFFESELDALERQLLALEARIAQFKRVNSASLPDTLPFQRTQLLEVSGELDALNRQIFQARQPAGASIADNAQARSLQHRLRAKTLALRQIQEDRATFAPLAEKDVIPRNRIREIDRNIAATELDIEVMEIELAAAGGAVGSEDVIRQLERRRDELALRAQEINQSILRAPRIESELSAMTRDHENLKAEYSQAQARLLDATTGERLEENRQAERFEVIEHATRPETPITLGRKSIVLAGAGGGLALGFAAVVLLELLDRSIRTVADMEKRLQIRPIASIPYVQTTSEKRRRRRRTAVLWLLAIVGIATTLALVHWFYLPLDLLVKNVPLPF